MGREATPPSLLVSNREAAEAAAAAAAAFLLAALGLSVSLAPINGGKSSASTEGAAKRVCKQDFGFNKVRRATPGLDEGDGSAMMRWLM
jgi:hypothetical protein